MSLRPYRYPGRMMLTLMRCPDHPVLWWLVYEDSLLNTHKMVTRRNCGCERAPERVRAWPIECVDLSALPFPSPVTVEAEIAEGGGDE